MMMMIVMMTMMMIMVVYNNDDDVYEYDDSCQVFRENDVQDRVLDPVKILREIYLTQLLCKGENIIKLYNVYKEKKTSMPALVYEYVDNTYFHILYPQLRPIDCQHYGYEVLKAIAYFHSLGIFHRDIKPNNIMIDHSIKKLRIIDLGLAKFYFPDDSNMRVGSLAYMSPELIIDYPKYDLSVDMWAFGCILAGWIFRVNIFFKQAINEEHQLFSIAKVLGSKDLLSYTQKYQMNTLTLFTKVYDYYTNDTIPQIPWEYFINDDNREFVTKDGLDLLSRLMIHIIPESLKYGCNRASFALNRFS